MRTITNTVIPIVVFFSTVVIGLFVFKNLSKSKDKVLMGKSSILTHHKLPLKKNTMHRDDKLPKIADEVQEFSKIKGYNKQIAFLIDMSIPSGQNRFFVYNMDKDSIEQAALVTHGYGSSTNEIEFSNVSGSYCTSLGKYKVGAAYQGRFGLAYKLYGLDKTNDKAFERFIVLHSHDCVPEEEVAPQTICESQGCPTVSPAFLKTLEKYLAASNKPIVLNIYK
ncbi:MAG TPA: murein L,D-transpeptidase catalytic domain family protein [Ferruginibacter sp.]|nr:murein L,D-transpeptidase catalytic domain family protein [Ferruginibacter sp.]